VGSHGALEAEGRHMALWGAQGPHKGATEGGRGLTGAFLRCHGGNSGRSDPKPVLVCVCVCVCVFFSAELNF